MMRKYNPVIVPYNYLVEEAWSAAEEGDMNPFYKLLSALEKPFEFSSSNEIFLNSPVDPNPYTIRHSVEHRVILSKKYQKFILKTFDFLINTRN